MFFTQLSGTCNIKINKIQAFTSTRIVDEAHNRIFYRENNLKVLKTQLSIKMIEHMGIKKYYYRFNNVK